MPLYSPCYFSVCDCTSTERSWTRAHLKRTTPLPGTRDCSPSPRGPRRRSQTWRPGDHVPLPSFFCQGHESVSSRFETRNHRKTHNTDLPSTQDRASHPGRPAACQAHDVSPLLSSSVGRSEYLQYTLSLPESSRADLLARRPLPAWSFPPSLPPSPSLNGRNGELRWATGGERVRRTRRVDLRPLAHIAGLEALAQKEVSTRARDRHHDDVLTCS